MPAPKKSRRVPRARRAVIENMPNKEFRKMLRDECACHTAKVWLRKRDLKTAWDEAPKGEWLGWLASIWEDRGLLKEGFCNNAAKVAGSGCVIFPALGTSAKLAEVLRSQIEVR